MSSEVCTFMPSFRLSAKLVRPGIQKVSLLHVCVVVVFQHLVVPEAPGAKRSPSLTDGWAEEDDAEAKSVVWHRLKWPGPAFRLQ